MQIATLAKSRWQKNSGVMDDITENSTLYVERGCERPGYVIHEFDGKFDDWAEKNERLRKSTGIECNQHFRQVLDKLFSINLEVVDPFASFDKPHNTHFQFKVAGQNHSERLQALGRLEMRPPHHQSMTSIDNYESFTKRDLFSLINRDRESNRCEVQSTISTSTLKGNVKVSLRLLQGLHILKMEDNDDNDDDEFEENILALNAKINVPPENSVFCIPSGHEEDLDAFKNANNRFRNRFNNNIQANKRQMNNQQKQPAKQ